MKSFAVILAVLVAVSLLPRNEAFTAGAGNIGQGDWPGKRELRSEVGAIKVFSLALTL